MMDIQEFVQSAWLGVNLVLTVVALPGLLLHECWHGAAALITGYSENMILEWRNGKFVMTIEWEEGTPDSARGFTVFFPVLIAMLFAPVLFTSIRLISFGTSNVFVLVLAYLVVVNYFAVGVLSFRDIRYLVRWSGVSEPDTPPESA